MHTFKVFSAFLTSAALAIPHVQYGYEPGGGPAHSFPDTTSLPSSTSIPASETLLRTTEPPVTTSVVTVTPSIIFNSTAPAATLSTPTEIAAPISSPVPEATPTSTPSPQAGVYICSDVNWSGTCTHIFSNPSSAPADCVQLDGTASSIGPDKGFECFFFTNAYCRPLQTNGSDFVQLVYPGEKNMLETYHGDFNDKVYSYFCLPKVDGDW